MMRGWKLIDWLVGCLVGEGVSRVFLHLHSLRRGVIMVKSYRGTNGLSLRYVTFSLSLSQFLALL